MRSGGLAGVEGCAKAGNTVVVWASDNYSVRQTATTGHFFGRSMFDRKRTGKPGVISCGRLPCSAASKAKPPGRIFGEAQRIGILRKKLVMADLKAHLNPAVWWRSGCRFYDSLFEPQGKGTVLYYVRSGSCRRESRHYGRTALTPANGGGGPAGAAKSGSVARR